MTRVYFTTSWDDGHPLDMRLGELLAGHGFGGTFFVPRANIEGRPVLSTNELRDLSREFEIGSHTHDHIRLDRVPVATASQQILDGKRRTEDELGSPVAGFCYPGGVHNAAIRGAVQTAGFRYARTISNFHIDASADLLRVPTTIQLYPHRRYTYAKNFVRGGAWDRRSGIFSIALRATSFEDTLRRMLECAVYRGGVFHLWGHSWEIEQENLWGVLERFLRHAAEVVERAHRVDNFTAYVRKE
jgi:peptidoglycan/xylan/chitin deacetylase (PgdA/CDA1 family)